MDELSNRIGLIDLKPKESSLIEFKELICWLGFAKITKKVRRMFSDENSAINLLEDVLSNYSHRKLDIVLYNESIRALLIYFIDNGKQNFMNSLGLYDNPSSFNINLPK